MKKGNFDGSKMRMTKRIEEVNVLNKTVLIEPIDYNIALTVIELMEEAFLLVNKIADMLKKYCKETSNTKKTQEINSLILERREFRKKEKQLREKHNYWYAGINNLDKDDIEMIKNKYPRRR